MRTTHSLCLQVQKLQQERDLALDKLKQLGVQLLELQAGHSASQLHSSSEPAVQSAHFQQQVASQLEQASAGTLSPSQPAMPCPDRHAAWQPSTVRDQQSEYPALAALLRRIAIQGEVAVAISNRFLATDGYMLHMWCAFRHSLKSTRFGTH
jgi:hypothetical protein